MNVLGSHVVEMVFSRLLALNLRCTIYRKMQGNHQVSPINFCMQVRCILQVTILYLLYCSSTSSPHMDAGLRYIIHMQCYRSSFVKNSTTSYFCRDTIMLILACLFWPYISHTFCVWEFIITILVLSTGLNVMLKLLTLCVSI